MYDALMREMMVTAMAEEVGERKDSLGGAYGRGSWREKRLVGRSVWCGIRAIADGKRVE